MLHFIKKDNFLAAKFVLTPAVYNIICYLHVNWGQQ